MLVDGACIARRQESPAHRVIAGIALGCALLASGFVTACGQSKTPDQHATAAPYDSGGSEAPHALQLALIDPDREVRRAAIARLAARLAIRRVRDIQPQGPVDGQQCIPKRLVLAMVTIPMNRPPAGARGERTSGAGRRWMPMHPRW